MKRILVIEDEQPLRDAFALLLDKEGYKVATAENGEVGLAKLRTFKPDLIILDMLMPVVNGTMFLRKAKLPVNHPSVKLVLLSNLSDPLSQEYAIKQGVSSVVLKADISPTQLQALIQKTLADSDATVVTTT